MRSSDEIYQALMEITRGNDAAITSGTVPQLLERAKEIVRSEVEQKYQSEFDRRKATESELSYFHAEEVRRETERNNRLHEKSNKFAKNTIKILRVTAFLLLILGVFLTLPLEFIVSNDVVVSILSNFPKFILPLIFLIMLVLGVLGQYYGTTIQSWFNSLEISVEKRVYKFLWSLSN